MGSKSENKSLTNYGRISSPECRKIKFKPPGLFCKRIKLMAVKRRADLDGGARQASHEQQRVVRAVGHGAHAAREPERVVQLAALRLRHHVPAHLAVVRHYHYLPIPTNRNATYSLL